MSSSRHMRGSTAILLRSVVEEGFCWALHVEGQPRIRCRNDCHLPTQLCPQKTFNSRFYRLNQSGYLLRSVRLAESRMGHISQRWTTWSRQLILQIHQQTVAYQSIFWRGPVERDKLGLLDLTSSTSTKQLRSAISTRIISSGTTAQASLPQTPSRIWILTCRRTISFNGKVLPSSNCAWNTPQNALDTFFDTLLSSSTPWGVIQL